MPVPLLLENNVHEPVFDLLLIAHVATALVGFGTLVASGVQALRVQRTPPGELAESLRRYFTPGFNWAGRVVYGVPLFGFLLLADSGGHLRLSYPWVEAGLGLWVISILLAEGLLWPAERRIQAALAAGSVVGLSSSVRRDCLVVAALGGFLGVVFVVVTVLMVARPH
ncbi:MAG: DUF2269 family protein [Acidimicrobiales bacterium]